MNIVKYPGGKEKELDLIKKHLPEHIRYYYEPFVGGGSVYLGIDAEKYFINDFSSDLINLYCCVKDENPDFWNFLDAVNSSWKNLDRYAAQDTELRDGFYSIYIGFRDHLVSEEQMKKLVSDRISSDVTSLRSMVSPLNAGREEIYTDELLRIFRSKFQRMKTLEYTKKHISDEDVRENILGCFKASYYMYLRHLYNHPENFTEGTKAMLYLFMRDMCYSSMFRFNSSGEFNVPYGGISYNRKNYDATIEKYGNNQLLEKMKNTEISCCDYLEFLKKLQPEPDDFMFIDPPYDSEFSTYDQNVFDQDAQWRLAVYLIHECKCNFMVDIKYTDYIASLYDENKLCANGNKLNIVFFDKTYSVSFMDRNNKKTEHMLIMNY